MANINHIFTNWTSGELSPMLFGRVDINKYFNGAQTIENFIIRAFGGAFRRPGTYYAGTTKYSTSAVRLIPFEFNTEQAYVIEMGDRYLRFFMKNGQILGLGGVPYEVSTNYLASEVFDVKFAQSADTMYLTHPSHSITTLTRTAHDSWNATAINTTGGPWEFANTTTNSMSATALTGLVLVSSSAAYFTAAMSGAYLRIGTSNGYVQITSTNSVTTASANVISTLEQALTDDWALGSWNGYNGYPSCCTFYEQRLMFANSWAQPQTVWGSASQDYTNFTPGALSADALDYTIATNQVNEIEWLSSGKTLVIGTAGGAFVMSSGSLNEALTPTNVSVKLESTYGVDELLPKRISGYVFFIQSNGVQTREMSYRFDTDSYQAIDITLLAEHILKPGVKDMEYQQSPDNIFWNVRTDGVIATMTRQTDQEVVAWSRILTGNTNAPSQYKSVTVIPNGAEDQVWVITARSLNGVAIQNVEYFMPLDYGDDQRNCFFVDCGLSRSGSPLQIIGGLSHLNSCNVTCLVDGATHPTRHVTGGYITLNGSYNHITVGLPYTSTLETLKMEGGGGGTQSMFQGFIKRIYEITTRLYKSIGMIEGGDTIQDIVPFRTSAMAMNSACALFTGDKTIKFPQGWNKDGIVKIYQDQALPLNVLLIATKVELAEE